LTVTVELSNVPGAPSGVTPDWHSIDWNQARRSVRRLQVRIVKAAKERRWRAVRSLQRLLVRSTAAKALAVRRVTDNRGKRTPGVDGIVWRTPEAKAKAVTQLGRKGYRPLPLRRVYIPKANAKKKRPLSIPVMFDRAMQALHLMALDPVAETLMEPHAYGFRVARSTADAIERCFSVLCQRTSARWILEGDIRSCFDQISHDWLIAHIPMDKGVLRKWLKVGFMEDQTLMCTHEGTPQGGIISPTLMNLTLNGLEASLRGRFPAPHRRTSKQRVYVASYADDFIITGSSKELLDGEVKPLVVRFLAERGLELSKEKTQVTPIEKGFDFLGQHIRKYDNGKLLIMPSGKSQRAFRQKVSGIIRRLRAAPQAQVISALNPVIRGWANYHRHVVSKRVFNRMDCWLWHKLWRWAVRRHPGKSKRWIRRRYFHRVGSRHWVFKSADAGSTGRAGHALIAMAATPIRRHVRLKTDANPYDPEWETYYEARFDRSMKDHRRSGLRILWRRQSGCCGVCHQKITRHSGWATHHRISISKGGADTLDNLVLLHPDCHGHLHLHDTAGSFQNRNDFGQA